MKTKLHAKTSYRLSWLACTALSGLLVSPVLAEGEAYKGPDFDLVSASVSHVADLDLLIFQQKVAGRAGGTTPRPAGKLDGAPVLAYVFPTTLASTDVGFGPSEGTVALVASSHPDFDDSPLWDENGDGNPGNDGLSWHTHWVVLVPDQRVPGGLSVKEFRRAEKAEAVVLPPTNSGMPMFMDSPGHPVVAAGDTLRVLVPAQRVRSNTTFRYDAVTCFLKVAAASEPAGSTERGGAHGHGADLPMLGVHAVFEVLSGNLSLPYTVQRK